MRLTATLSTTRNPLNLNPNIPPPLRTINLLHPQVAGQPHSAPGGEGGLRLLFLVLLTILMLVNGRCIYAELLIPGRTISKPYSIDTRK